SEDFDFTPQLQADAIKNHQSSALYDVSDVMIYGTPIMKVANEFLNKMEDFFSDFQETKNIIAYERNKLNGQRICEKIKARSEVYV
ncbi:MAG: hypothetical protein NC548_42170, partial [Lachnospiraceae bacterium]|nr:hypothetical protein [Lachnospiraceae bacterium]